MFNIVAVIMQTLEKNYAEKPVDFDYKVHGF